MLGHSLNAASMQPRNDSKRVHRCFIQFLRTNHHRSFCWSSGNRAANTTTHIQHRQPSPLSPEIYGHSWVTVSPHSFAIWACGLSPCSTSSLCPNTNLYCYTSDSWLWTYVTCTYKVPPRWCRLYQKKESADYSTWWDMLLCWPYALCVNAFPD